MGVDDRCRACGTALVAGARFCHRCGAPAHTTVIDLADSDGLVPGGSPSSRPGQLVRTRTPRLAVVASLAVVAVLIGLVVVTGDDTDEDAVGGDTVEDAVDDAEDDEPPPPSPGEPSPRADTASAPAEQSSTVVVEQAGVATTALRLDAQVPLGLATTTAGVYLLAGEVTQETWGLPEFISTTLWHAPDGENWAPLDAAGEPGATVTTLASDGDELVVAGTSSAGDLTVWRSPDGAAWSGATVPSSRAEAGRLELVTGLAVSDDRLALIALQRPTLGARLPDPMPASISLDWDDELVVVIGPLGLELAQYEPAELGMSPEEVASALTGDPFEGATLIAGDGSDWDVIETLSWVDRVTRHPNSGEFVAIGATDDGPGTFRWSPDEGWTFAVGDESLRTRLPLAEWGSRSVTVGDGDILVEGPRLDWVPVGLRRILGDAEVEPVDVVTDGDRLVVTTFGYPGSRVGGGDLSVSVVAIVDGGTIGYDPATSRIEVESEADGRRAEYPAWSVEPGEDYVVDLASSTVTFLDDEDGTPLLAAPFSVLEALQERSFFTSGDATVMRVLASVDGTAWTIGPTQRAGYPAHVVIHDDAAVVATWGIAGEGLRVNRITLHDDA